MSRFAPLLLAFLAAGCARAGTGPDPQAGSPVSTAGLVPVAGAAYRDRMPFMGRDLPLPPGEWRLLSVTTLADKGRVLVARVFMEQHAGAFATRVLAVAGTPAGMSRTPTALDEVCAVSDVIDNRIRSADPTGEQDCITVNFGSAALIRASFARMSSSAPGMVFNANAFNNMFGALDARNLALSPTVVLGAVALSHRSQQLSLTLIYNPDADGVPPDPSPLRSTNSWARFNLDRDPAKKAYVARVMAEMEAYRLRLLDALDRPAQMPEAPVQRSTSLAAPPAG